MLHALEKEQRKSKGGENRGNEYREPVKATRENERKKQDLPIFLAFLSLFISVWFPSFLPGSVPVSLRFVSLSLPLLSSLLPASSWCVRQTFPWYVLATIIPIHRGAKGTIAITAARYQSDRMPDEEDRNHTEEKKEQISKAKTKTGKQNHTYKEIAASGR